MKPILALTFVILTANSIRQDDGFWAFLEKGRVVSRCPAPSPAHQRAAARLERLDEIVLSLKNSDPVGTAVAEFHDLLKTDCFLPAAETDRIVKPDTAMSLKAWWIDSGGREWLSSFLELPRLGPVDGLAAHVVVPADARDTLNLESHRDHPLRVLLCPASDEECGAATRGWKLRADAYFEAQRTSGLRDDARPFDAPHNTDPASVSQACATQTSDAPPAQRYGRWRSCLETARPQQFALPLGDFKAPTTGWFVVAGRRGHYDFCDTTRAYDLATGSAFIYDSCSSLALKSGGDVDFDSTNKGRVLRVRSGVVPVDNLREAVWMALLRGEAKALQLRAEFYPLPAGMTPQINVESQPLAFASAGWINTAQTLLTWRWTPATDSGFVGALTWPNSYDAAESHAAALLAVFEEGFVESRCAQEKFPAASTFISSKDLRLNETTAEAIREHDRDFNRASEKWRALPVCLSPAR